MTNPTSYSAITLDYVHEYFDLAIQMRDLFTVEPITPGNFLQTALQRAKNITLFSEKARSEFLIAPVLLEVHEYLHGGINIYSGIRFDVSPEEGLQGICDFIVSKSAPTPIVQAPLLLVVEAKKDNLDKGLGQCAGEMVAAQRFNQTKNISDNSIYGCVTNGELWQFLSLQEKIISIDPHRLYIENIDKIFGMLIKILS